MRLSCGCKNDCQQLHRGGFDLEPLRHLFRTAKNGFIIGISSVAGDRGRQSNYVNDAAKGALSLYLQGLCNCLFASGVWIITIKPGFVDTAMTYGMPKLFLVASQQAIGERIVRTLDNFADVVYRLGSGATS